MPRTAPSAPVKQASDPWSARPSGTALKNSDVNRGTDKTAAPPRELVKDVKQPRTSPKAARSGAGAAPLDPAAGAKRRAGLPAFIEPQLATLVTQVPEDPHWLHELKLDGYRILCRIEDGKVSLLTRNAQNWTDRFRLIAGAAAHLAPRAAWIDGEVVALDDTGKANFQLLQNFANGSAVALVYYAFDLLLLDGRDLRPAPLLERKKQLQKLLSTRAPAKRAAVIRYSEHWTGRGRELLHKACETGFEGVISKRLDEPHRPGRTRSWLKIKCAQSQEFVIGGFTDPAGARLGFGALLLGVHDERGGLRYAGKVGTGFDDRTLNELRGRLKKLARNTPAFSGALKGARFKNVHWVQPQLVGEVTFSGWTSDGLLRHPSFKGVREDKPAAEITRETAVPLRAAAPPSIDNEVAGVALSHPERVLYADQGITKLELARYYERIADWILPHLKGRPLTVVRCPRGAQQQCFYQRHPRAPARQPIQSMSVREKGKPVKYLSVDSLAGIIALVQMGVLELHTWGSCAPRLENPDRMIFDLDPGPDVAWRQIKQGAGDLRARLKELDLEAFVKTTGGKGVHVVVPLIADESWDTVKDVSRAIAEAMAGDDPAHYIATLSKAKRAGKIFIDYLRNIRSATAVSAYSPRARPGATVSMPLRWQDLDEDLRAHFTVRNVPEHLAGAREHPWRDYDAARRPLPAKLLRQAR